MKLTIRRIGNSLGVIVPRDTLRAWGVGEGDALELTGEAIRKPRRAANPHEALDRFKRDIALEVLRRCSLGQIREKSLSNLRRWHKAGSWSRAYEEWQQVLDTGSDGELICLMVGEDDRANRLRQSAPFVGLLPADTVERVREEASG